MKNRYYFSIATLAILCSCVSVKKYNLNLHTLKSEDRLKADVDFVYAKLQRLHPFLYGYTPKKELDVKMDSLKSSFIAPLTGHDLFFKISPVLALVRQGHLHIFPPIEQKTSKDLRVIRKTGFTPLSQFKYELIDGKLFIVGYNSGDTTIQIGTEVLAVNNVKPQEIISTYRNTLASDGYNSTHINYKLGNEFPDYFFLQNGEADSLTCRLKYNDSITSIILKRKSAHAENNNAEEQLSIEKDKNKEKNRNRTQPVSQAPRKLSFVEQDSSIAIMKISKFSTGNFHQFYRNSFRELKYRDTKYLILDLRNNPGGSVNEASELYAYLTDSSYCFLDTLDVASRTSVLHTPYFVGNKVVGKVILSIFLPLRLIPLGVDYFRVKNTGNGSYYYSTKLSKWKPAKEDRFDGKVYVLINGGSFSASCLLSSNLKGSGRAVFVGEETGGAYNGCVAGKRSAIILPESKMKMFFGLMHLQPHYKTEVAGHGIYPDVEIKPTLEDRINGNDPELNWILNEILHK